VIDQNQKTMEKKCKNCRYWGGDDWVECLRRCSAIEGNRHKSTFPDADGAYVAGFDEEGIMTGPNFGCVHFEVKHSAAAMPEEAEKFSSANAEVRHGAKDADLD